MNLFRMSLEPVPKLLTVAIQPTVTIQPTIAITPTVAITPMVTILPTVGDLKLRASGLQTQIGTLMAELKTLNDQIRKLESPQVLSNALKLPAVVTEWLTKKKMDFEFNCDCSGKHAHLSESIKFYSVADEIEYCLSQSKEEGCSAQIRITNKVVSSRQMETQVAFASGLLNGSNGQLTEDQWKNLTTSGNPIPMIFVMAINRFRDM